MPAPLREMPDEALELIKSFEGLPDGDPGTVNLDAYLDPLNIWTIGWGHALTVEGRFLKDAANQALARRLYPGGITRAQAETLLRADLLDRSPGLLNLVRVPLDDGQFGALMSFAFNCGLGNLGASTLLRLLNAGQVAAAAEQFLVWNKGRRDGVLVELPGLTRRRRAERAMFLGEDWRAASAPVRGRAAPPAKALSRPRRPAPERPVAPSVAAQREAAAASGAGKVLAKLEAKAAGTAGARSTASASAKAVTPRGRTTTSKAPPQPARAGRPAPRKAR